MAVTPMDIAVELGRTAPESSSTEYAQWERWIADALYLIGKRLTIADLDPDDVDYVVRQAVAAHVRRPDDATQVEVAVDDGRMARTYRSARGRVEIIDEWWALLSPPTSNGRAFSIRPTGTTANHLPWCSLYFGGAYCTCGANLTNFEYPLYEGGLLDGDEY